MRNMPLLKKLTQAFGVAGCEVIVRALIQTEVKQYADEIMTDSIGNLIVLKKGSGAPEGKRIMLAAHMDEIGFMVKKIEADGRLRVCNVGWNWAASAYNGRVRFRNGTVGVVGCIGDIHDNRDVGKLYVDIGAKSKEDAEQYVHIGDMCGYCGPFEEMKNGLICSKSLDNRIGCFQLIEALRQNDGSGPNDVYYVFTVQEEVGCRGSKPAAERILPDIGIAVDITPAHDYPCDLEGNNTVGAGVAIKYADPSVISDAAVVCAMVECCKEEGIPWQPEVIDKGGTDASSMNQSGWGVRTGGMAVATRYPHCQSSVASMDDIEAGIQLLIALTGYTFNF